MTTASKVLLDLLPEKEVVVTFNDGEKLVLKNIDPVDESIYQSSDLLTGAVVEVIRGIKIRRPGGLLQFSETDIVLVEDLQKAAILFARPSDQAS